MIFDDFTIRYADSQIEEMNIHPTGRIVNQHTTFNGWYQWNQAKDELELEFMAFLGEKTGNSVYIFTRTR